MKPKPLRTPSRFRPLAVTLAVLTTFAVFAQPVADSDTVQGLSLTATSTKVILTWPSDPRETFLVLVRCNAAPETQYAILTNHFPASPRTNRTTFLDTSGVARAHPGQPISELRDLYCVLLIPDFWFSPAGATLDGGPRKSGADFLPIYTGTPETDEFNRPFNLHVEMLVDAERASEEESFDLRAAVDDGVERVNLGSAKKPRWFQSTGFWLQHDQLTNGLHTLQLRTLLRLNTLVGPGEQFLTITNKSVIVMTTNKPAGSASRTSSASSQSAGSWWAERLGTRFVRNSPSNQAENQPNPKAARLIARPLDLSPAPR